MGGDSPNLIVTSVRGDNQSVLYTNVDFHYKLTNTTTKESTWYVKKSIFDHFIPLALVPNVFSTDAFS